MEMREIASLLSKHPIAAELPWSVGRTELVVLRAQDYNSYVKEGYVLREVDGESRYVKQRDYGRIAISSLDLVLPEAAFFEKLRWYNAEFFGISLPNPAGRPKLQDWSPEEKKKIRLIAMFLRSGLEVNEKAYDSDMLLAAKALNRAKEKKERGPIEESDDSPPTKPQQTGGPTTIFVYRNEECNPFCDLPFCFTEQPIPVFYK